MPPSDTDEGDPVERKQRWWVLLRGSTVFLWSILLTTFWQGARRADVGPLEFLFTSIEQVAARPRAFAGGFALYLVRSLLLVHITIGLP
jgi:hypothetical protein